MKKLNPVLVLQFVVIGYGLLMLLSLVGYAYFCTDINGIWLFGTWILRLFPLVCIIALMVSGFKYKDWTKEHKRPLILLSGIFLFFLIVFNFFMKEFLTLVMGSF